MKLQIVPRTSNKKSEANTLRREGFIPAVIYTKGTPCETIAIKKSEFAEQMRGVLPGHLPTTIFTLSTQDGKNRRVIIKEIQYKVTNYEVLHLDFEELHDDVKVKIKVPIECIGAVDCVGIKLGGVLRQVIRYLRVRCLPGDIPSSIEVDIRSMQLGESKRLAQLSLPSNVTPMADLNEVAVLIVRR